MSPGSSDKAMASVTVREPARDIPVYGRCDVLVVGGGPAGTAAAAAAAQTGADVILVERYGYLGGMSTGGFVLWIDRMTDWEGQQVIAGFADELLGRMPKEALLGAPRDAWGSMDPQVVRKWERRRGAYQGTVTWSPVIDPEMLKIVSSDLLVERGAKLLLHSWAVAPVQENGEVRGVVFESKAGRQAILAEVVIDATGDGDIFALAGAPFETDTQEGDIHSAMNVAFRWGGVDYDRYSSFRYEHQELFEAVMARSMEVIGMVARPVISPRNDVAFFMGPKFPGYNCTDIQDLTEVELKSRKLMLKMLAFYRDNVPGFENAWIIDTAPQIGTRHSRRVVGVKKVTRPEWTSGWRHADEIGICPPPSPRYPNISVPLGCLVPVDLDNLLVAGRNLSCDAPSHSFLREIPVCWVMGQAAGVAAAVAVSSGVRTRDVDIKEVQRQLLGQGVYLRS